MILKPCIECGTPSVDRFCPDCEPPRTPKASAHRRGYDHTWQQLSKRARRMQPFCTDCGARDDLTCDHSEEAWKRKNAGLPIRLEDVAVVCRSCNSKRGRARPTGDDPRESDGRPVEKAEFRSHTQGGIR